MEFCLDMEAVKHVYLLEKHRFESFKSWPFKSTDLCCIEKMAEAGFYWCGNDLEMDTAACFACNKVLDGWESTDDPWLEHQKHAPQCAFVKLGRPEKDLTVEEFLSIFNVVARNHLQKMFNQKKKKLIQDCEKKRELIKHSN